MNEVCGRLHATGERTARVYKPRPTDLTLHGCEEGKDGPVEEELLPPTTAIDVDARAIACIEGAGRGSAAPVARFLVDPLLHTTKGGRERSGVARADADAPAETGPAEGGRDGFTDQRDKKVGYTMLGTIGS